MHRFSLLVLALLLACKAESRPPADPATLDPVARQYVVLGLQLGAHDPNYVDAYYGPDSLRTIASGDSATLQQIRVRAESLLTVLGDSTPEYQEDLVRMRHRYLRSQLASMVARARMLEGEKFTFDEEAKALFDAEPPRYTDAHFDSLLVRLDSLLPGTGPVAQRFTAFRNRVTIPAARVDTVFKRAIAACRARTMEHMSLPEGERFDLEYVTGKSWNAYNWYKGGYVSLIQVNTDLPIAIDRAIDLACHEGYPGHHVYNASLEHSLVRERGWNEFAFYPLFSPQSFIAEGSANLGIDMAFPDAERMAFERDSLFPLAGLDTSLAALNAQVRQVNDDLNYARNEVARRYLNGELDRAGAEAALVRYWLITPEAAARNVRFIDTYRSYVINYNLGRDMVARWVEDEGGEGDDGRWRAFSSLLASPRLPADLTVD